MHLRQNIKCVIIMIYEEKLCIHNFSQFKKNAFDIQQNYLM